MSGPIKRKRSSGLSLIEVMMQLVILSIVTVPTLMLLNAQKHTAAQQQLETKNLVITNALFDNFLPQHPDPTVTTTYNVAKPISIYCDPASRIPTSGTCGSGTQAPFFTRTLAMTSDVPGVRVQIKLFSATNSATPFFQASRVYRFDAYRIKLGNPITSSTIGNFEGVIQPDQWGNIWYPQYVTGGSNLQNQSYYSSSCNPGTGSSTASFPFDTYLNITHSACPNGFIQDVKAQPGATYDVNFYFSSNVTSGCSLPGYTGVSCALADIGYTYTGLASPIPLANNFDIAAASSFGDPNAPGLVVHKTITLPQANFSDMQLVVKSSGIANNTQVPLAGIEVIKRQDQ